MSQPNSSPRAQSHDRNDSQDKSLNPEALSLSYEELFDSKLDDDGPCYLPSYVSEKLENDDGGETVSKDEKNEEDGVVRSKEGASEVQAASGHDYDKATSDYQEKFIEGAGLGESDVTDMARVAERKEDSGEQDEQDKASIEKVDFEAQEEAEVLNRPQEKDAGRDNGNKDHKKEENGRNGYAGITEIVESNEEKELNGRLVVTARGSTEITATGQDQELPKSDLKHLNEDDSSVAWRKHKKHFFILSHAGKPIYSRYGDEHKLAGFAATLQAIMSFVENSGDRIKYVKVGDHQIVFLVKGPIYLVSISATDEPLRALRGQLELLHGQLLLILTKSLEKCYIKNANFDLRPLLGGTEAVFSSLTHSFSWNPASFLSSYTCLPLSHTARQAAGAALQDVADADLLFALLLSDSKVISLVGAQKASLHPDDMLLLSNFVSSSESFKTTESFSPVCLPKYNSTAFLYAYVRYLDANTCLILITKNPDSFFHLKECRARVESFLMETHVLRDIANSVARGGLRVEDLPGDGFYGALAGSNGPGKSPESGQADKGRLGVGGPAGLWHFIYRSIYLDQYVASEFSPPLHKPESQKRLYRAYQRLYASMHGAPAGSHQMQYRRDENHVLLVWSTADFEFLAAFDPLAEKSSAITVCNRVCQWIRDVENDFFFVGASPFNW